MPFLPPDDWVPVTVPMKWLVMALTASLVGCWFCWSYTPLFLLFLGFSTLYGLWVVRRLGKADVVITEAGDG